jgi:hypothetical protein
MQRQRNPKKRCAREFRAWMNHAVETPSSIVCSARNGFAGPIFLIRNGIPVRPSRARVDTALPSLSPNEALALAQHPAREFLTEAQAFASVEVCGVPPYSASARRANLPR